MRLTRGPGTGAAGLREAISKARPLLAASPRRVAALVSADIGAAIAEAAILVIVVQIATSIADANAVVEMGVGPIGPLPLTLPTLFALAGALALVRFGLKSVDAIISPRMSNDVMLGLRERAVAAFLAADWETQGQVRFGHIGPLLGNQIARVAQLTMQVSTAIGAAISVVVLFVAALAIDVSAAVIIVVGLVVLFFALRPLSQMSRRYSATVAEANKTIGVATHELVDVALETHILGVEAEMEARVRASFLEQSHAYVRSQRTGKLVPSLYQSAGLLLIVGALALLYYSGLAALSSLTAIVLLFYRALGYGQGLQSTYHTVIDTLPFVELCEETIGEWDARRREPGSVEIGTFSEIRLDEASYSYDGDRFALQNVSFAVRSGESVGIIGPSGAGKSTLVQLLLGLRDPTTGATLVNGIPVRHVLPADWSRLLAYVPQDTHLIGTSVRENIRFFRSWITDDEVEEAARQAGLHPEIIEWDDGYDRYIDDRHVTLSGGQRQRLSIARALAGKPEILILDEPTSALDMRSEQLIHSTLTAMKGRVTLFVIAHRMSTLNICDRIMVLEDGRVRAFEPAETLQASSDFYREALTLSGISSSGTTRT